MDVKPWGGGYVRSDPYLLDCPKACIRPFDQNREVKLTAYVTPGHTFTAWEGACAGQGNPCTLTVTGAIVDVTAVALWTRQNKRGRPGRYRFVLAADWDTRALEDGEYLVEVAASDVSRNTGSRRFPIRIANRTHV